MADHIPDASKMAERPILFSAPMVRALLDGRKIQTRRVLEPQPDSDEAMQHGAYRSAKIALHVPFAPGDRLWVKETWASDVRCAHLKPSEISADETIFYNADGAQIGGGGFAVRDTTNRPSLFMPRWASRLTLLVTDVRVQRLHDISEADAQAEGCRGSVALIGEGVTAKSAFRLLWNSINGPEAWAQNPWVAAITFDVQRGNIDQVRG